MESAVLNCSLSCSLLTAPRICLQQVANWEFCQGKLLRTANKNAGFCNMHIPPAPDPDFAQGRALTVWGVNKESQSSDVPGLMAHNPRKTKASQWLNLKDVLPNESWKTIRLYTERAAGAILLTSLLRARTFSSKMRLCFSAPRCFSSVT